MIESDTLMLQLQDISLVMSDGHHFTKLRFFLEEIDARVKDPEITTDLMLEASVLKVVSQFARLCRQVENM